MKKYLLTALLGVFGLCTAFASAYTVDGFTSESEIYSYTLSNSNGVEFTSLSVSSDFYVCFSTSDIPFYYKTYYVDSPLINSSNYCSSVLNQWDDDSFEFYSDSNFSELKSISGKMYYSTSPMIYSSSSGGGSSSSSSSTILSGGISQLSPVISSISSVMSEFIPYVVYIGIGILLVTLGFKAIKRLVNWLSSKITRYFK